MFTARGGAVTLNSIHEGGQKKKTWGAKNPLADFKNIFHTLKPSGAHDFPFTLGAAGFLSYDYARFFEKLPAPRKSRFTVPDLYFILCRHMLIFSHKKNKTYFLVHVPWCATKARAKTIAQKEFHDAVRCLETASRKENPGMEEKALCKYPARLSSTMTKAQYMSSVKKVKKYIAAGDIYQANIAQQFSADFRSDAFLFYRNLMNINPSPFSAYIDAGDFRIASCSPERLLKVHGQTVETRPIAGTRPRGTHKREDEALAKELLLNAKERAEHLMLVDLERNDIGKVCGYSSVHVDEFMVREDYSHVFHIVSNVRGVLQKNKDSFDAIQTCFPGGTITGCPKIRSMEIIREAENFRRGIYTGSIGYINFNGDLDFNIAIRTAFLHNNVMTFSTGAGIVADSEPEREYHETLYKAEALVRAIEKTQGRKIENFAAKIFKPENMP